MRSFVSIVSGTVMLCLVSASCGREVAEGCPRAIGVFHGQYSYLSGSCGPTFQGRPINIESTDTGEVMKTTNSLSDSVTTRINLVGCTIGMRQEISDMQGMRLVSAIAGDLDVEDSTALSGQITRIEYMADGTTVRCTGQYNAYYSLDDVMIGGAAQTALGGP